MYHRLSRGEAASLRVDADLWLCALDLACVEGWRPRGADVPEAGPGEPDRDPFTYHIPLGQRVAEEDAQDLARCLEAALPKVSDQVVPMRASAFGEERTHQLIKRAAGGHSLETDTALAPREILSGPPKAEARELVEFLRGGEFTIQPADRG